MQAGEEVTGELLGFAGPPSFAKLVNKRLSERPCLKMKGRACTHRCATYRHPTKNVASVGYGSGKELVPDTKTR